MADAFRQLSKTVSSALKNTFDSGHKRVWKQAGYTGGQAIAASRAIREGIKSPSEAPPDLPKGEEK